MKDDVLQAVIAGAKANGSWDARYGEVSIKEALAQPEQEPVGTVAVNDWIEMERAVGYRDGYEAALKQVTQPEQEPVASYLPEMSIPNFSARVAWGAPDHIDLRNGWRPLYTTPPKRPWVGLTDEEIAYAYTLEKKFAMQYVDAKLKEKNT